MFSFLVHCLLYALSVMLAAKIVPGLRVRSYGSALVFAAVFGILDGLLFKFLAIITLPIVILTLGLFLLVIRAFLFWLADQLVDGVQVEGFWAAFLGSLVTGIINFLINRLVHI
jgi:putative membrane protein